MKYPAAEPSKHSRSRGRRPYLSLSAPSTGAAQNRQAAYAEVSRVTITACFSRIADVRLDQERDYGSYDTEAYSA
ncbi:hypothetical protein ACFTAO_18270 [Paenibacillus rhizoplanae]